MQVNKFFFFHFRSPLLAPEARCYRSQPDFEQHAPLIVRKKTSRNRNPDVTSLQNGLFTWSETCFTTFDLFFKNPLFGNRNTELLFCREMIAPFEREIASNLKFSVFSMHTKAQQDLLQYFWQKFKFWRPQDGKTIAYLFLDFSSYLLPTSN